ncbi:MAG: hypothetical protein U1E76_09190 [Planctomycetota bacterium]
MSAADDPLSQTGGNGADRLPNGQFRLGHRSPGPGRPKGSGPAQQVRELLARTITEADVLALLAKLRELADAGDLQAIRELLRLRVGCVTATDVDVDAQEQLDAVLAAFCEVAEAYVAPAMLPAFKRALHQAMQRRGLLEGTPSTERAADVREHAELAAKMIADGRARANGSAS